MQEFLIAMENETGEMCFYYLFNFMGYYYVETTPGEKKRKQLVSGTPGRYVKLVFLF